MTNSLASTLRTGCLAIPIGPRNRRVINAVATVEAQTIPLVQNLLLTRPSQRISMLRIETVRALDVVSTRLTAHMLKKTINHRIARPRTRSSPATFAASLVMYGGIAVRKKECFKNTVRTGTAQFLSWNSLTTTPFKSPSAAVPFAPIWAYNLVLLA